jgi:hypothetical protein
MRDQVFQKHLEGVPEGEFHAFVLDPNKVIVILKKKNLTQYM